VEERRKKETHARAFLTSPRVAWRGEVMGAGV
jgi:hypothetical protein